MKNHKNQLRLKLKRTAFTLVEMLIVGAIIVILAGLTLLATNAAATAAKETKTRAVIQKIDTAMQQIFETYEDKLLAIQNDVNKKHSSQSEETRQKIITHYIRDTIRMEMPQSWAEVYDSANPSDILAPLIVKIDSVEDHVAVSPLLNFYWTAYDTAKKATGKEPNRAALLFLIIQNLNPEALDAFQPSEVADTDGDGLLEFVDAWGNPIHFLRWAPAFSGSSLQPDILRSLKFVPDKNMQENQEWWENKIKTGDVKFKEAAMKAQAEYPDPMDPNGISVSWFLYPLIYSAGSDEKYDITSELLRGGKPASPTVAADGILDPFAFPAGMPGDDDGNGALNHFDNIHNHQWYRTY